MKQGMRTPNRMPVCKANVLKIEEDEARRLPEPNNKFQNKKNLNRDVKVLSLLIKEKMVPTTGVELVTY